MSVSNGPSIITSGLVLSLDAADKNSYPGSGTAWTDLSGNNNNGTLTNGPTFSSVNQGAIVFDGTDDYVKITSVLLSGNDSFTINQWIQAAASETGGTIFANYPAGNLQIFYGSGGMGLWLANDSTYVLAPIPFLTTPVMITAIRSGITTFFYQNGVLLKTGSSSNTIGSTNDFRLGENVNGAEEFTGNIFSTQVYNRALSASEVAQNYSATKTRFGL